MASVRRSSFSEAVAAKAEVPVKVEQHRFITKYQSEQKSDGEPSRVESKSDSVIPPGTKLDRIEFSVISERSPTGGDITVVTVGSPIVEAPTTPVKLQKVEAPAKFQKPMHGREHSREISSSVITVATDETAMLTDLIENIKLKEAVSKARIAGAKNPSMEVPESVVSFASSGAGATGAVSLPEFRISSDDLQQSKDYPTLTLRMRTPNKRDLEKQAGEGSLMEESSASSTDTPRIAGTRRSKKTTQTASKTAPKTKVPMIARIAIGVLALLLAGATIALAALLVIDYTSDSASSVNTVLLATSSQARTSVIKSGFADLLNVNSTIVEVTLDSADSSSSSYSFYVVIKDVDYVPQVQAAAIAGDLSLSATMLLSKISVPSQNLEITVCSFGYAGSDCSSCHPSFTKQSDKCILS